MSLLCPSSCLNGGICTSNGYCQCQPCFMGNSCQTAINANRFSLTFAMQWDFREYENTSRLNVPKFLYTFSVSFLLFFGILNVIPSLMTFFLPVIRSTNCGIFQILYCITGLSSLIGMMMRLLTTLVFDQTIHTYAYRYIACKLLPVFVIITADCCIWVSALVAIEFFIIELFSVNLHRTRWYSFIVSSIVFIIIFGSHTHEILGRYPFENENDPYSYSCKSIYTLPVDLIDKILRVLHVIIPCSIHFICALSILIQITIRACHVRNTKNYLGMFFTQCVKRKHFVVPPIFIILFNTPHLILHLKDQCEDARDTILLRTHISFNIMVYIPAASVFFIYIYPSKNYMRRFALTPIGRCFQRLVKCCRSTSIYQKKLFQLEKYLRRSSTSTRPVLQQTKW